jgi:hypothetical protein
MRAVSHSLFHKESLFMRLSSKRTLLRGAVAGLCTALLWAVGPTLVTARDDAKKIEEGKPAPEVELPATQVGKVLPDKKDAKTLNLKDLQGQKIVVLYFFPKALTAG